MVSAAFVTVVSAATFAAQGASFAYWLTYAVLAGIFLAMLFWTRWFK